MKVTKLAKVVQDTVRHGFKTRFQDTVRHGFGTQFQDTVRHGFILETVATRLDTIWYIWTLSRHGYHTVPTQLGHGFKGTVLLHPESGTSGHDFAEYTVRFDTE